MDRDCSGSEGLQITDSAKNFLKVLKDIKPPLPVVVEVLRGMTKDDRSRHSNIAEDDAQCAASCGESWTSSYVRYLGSQRLIAGLFGNDFDFAGLPQTERNALLEGLASFKEVEIRGKLLPIALGWIEQARARVCIARAHRVHAPPPRPSRDRAHQRACVCRLCARRSSTRSRHRAITPS